MLLCFGTYASVLRLCAQETVKNKVLVSTLVRTIDKNEQYGASGNDTQVSRLINCKGDFPSVQVESGSGAVRTNGGSMTEIVALAREVTTGQLLEEFQNTVIPLLDEDKKDEAVLALLDIISKDKSITGAHQKAFEKYLGMSANRLVELAEINLTSFLAGLFLYSVVVGSNNSNAARETLTAIRGEFYLDSLKMKKDSLRVCEERNESIGKAKVEPAGAYQKYLDALKEKYNTVKTLLYTDTPRPFYDFYVCNDVYRTILAKTHPRRYRNEVISDADARKFLSVSRYIILRGTGGLGKSMMMRHLLLDSIERYPETGVVPIFVSLKDYNETYDDLSDYIYSCVRGLWKSLTKEHLRKLLASGKALLLLDGLDEIHSSCAGQYERALDDFVDAYPDNMYIISSRPFISFASYARFTILHLQPFNKSQALKLVDNIDFREDEPVIKQKFRRELDTKLFYSHKEFAENPLLLTIMLMTFEQFAEVPSKMHIFYREAFVALSQKHDASKGSYHRAFHTGLTADQLSDCFSEFCYRSYVDEKFEFTHDDFRRYYDAMRSFGKIPQYSASLDDFIFDLCSNLCLMYKEGNAYHFTHRSFQEYFCALYFSRMKDTALERIGNFFEKHHSTRSSDNTFDMMCDMIPDQAAEYIFVPRLRELFDKCDAYAEEFWEEVDSEDEDGNARWNLEHIFSPDDPDPAYWRFLDIMYQDAELGEGEVRFDASSNPASYIYGFITRRNGIDHYYLDVDELDGADIDDFRESTYVSYLDSDGESVVVKDNEVPSDYMETHGEEPEIVGHIYRVPWMDVWNDVSKYESLAVSIQSEFFKLRKEYLAMRKFFEDMKRQIKENDDDLHDLLPW